MHSFRALVLLAKQPRRKFARSVNEDRYYSKTLISELPRRKERCDGVNLCQGKVELVRASRVFELTEFELADDTSK